MSPPGLPGDQPGLQALLKADVTGTLGVCLPGGGSLAPEPPWHVQLWATACKRQGGSPQCPPLLCTCAHTPVHTHPSNPSHPGLSAFLLPKTPLPGSEEQPGRHNRPAGPDCHPRSAPPHGSKAHTPPRARGTLGQTAIRWAPEPARIKCGSLTSCQVCFLTTIGPD